MKEILLKYLNEHEGWHKKVNLYLVADNEDYSPESAGRALRTLAEDNEILVDYYKGKRKQKLARYSRNGTPVIKSKRIEYTIEDRPDGTRVARIINPEILN
ncbi:MAG: hypothetical protein ACR2IQ_02760 [Minisyncoccia bacterium]